MSASAADAPPTVPARAAGDMERALTLCVALLGGTYIVVRPIAGQFMPYSGDAAFAGLAVVLLAFILGVKMLLSRRPFYAPDRLVLTAVLWLGIFVWGALRSPNLGAAVPQACDAAVYFVLLLCGYFAVRRDRALVGVFTRAVVAMVAVEAFAAVWQRYVELPRLWAEVKAGRELVPEALQSAMGQARLYGNDAFGSFGNPNSLAAYLLVGICLLPGLCWPSVCNNPPGLLLPQSGTIAARPAAPRRQRVLGVLLLLLMLAALLATNSKGGCVALLAGGWFYGTQYVAWKYPRHGRRLTLLTAAGIALILAALALGMAGVIPVPRSLEVRYEYWRAALRMVREHPLDGVGLGGFAEYYSYFKTTLGTETREAHNDYLHLFAELGVLGPLVYLTLWGLLLHAGGRRLPDAAVGGTLSPATGDGDDTGKDGRAVTFECLAVAGGVVGFVLMFVAFRVFNSPDVTRLLAGTVDLQTVGSTLHTLGLPLIFACVVVGLRPAGRRQPGVAAPETPPVGGTLSPATTGVELVPWTFSVRAAAGAVLVHQLVDFDLKAQAVMGALFLLGGMMFALHEESGDRASVPEPPTELNRVSRYLLPVLAVALFVGAVWIPMWSGVQRAGAEALEEEVRGLLRAKPPEGQDLAKDREYRELRREIAALRLKAAQAAPFDGSAWLDVAAAYEGMQRAHRSTSMNKEILVCLDEAERLRPVAAAPKLMRGDYLFLKALRESRRNQPPSVLFLAAAKAYGAAAERYPLSPGLKLLLGDALLLSGQVEAAAAEYAKAFQTDMAIADFNIGFGGLLVDPHPSAAPRHGRDGDIREAIDGLPPELNPSRAPNGPVTRGLLVRRFVALASLLHEYRRRPVPNPLLVPRLGAYLTDTGKKLVAAMETPAERAHAALLLALSYELTRLPQAFGKAAAWNQARRLQEESVRAGTPGTQPRLFNYLAQRFGREEP